MREAKKSKKTLTIVAACKTCGAPIYGLETVSDEDYPQIKRTCSCTFQQITWCYHTDCNCNHYHWYWQYPYVNTWQSIQPYATVTFTGSIIPVSMTTPQNNATFQTLNSNGGMVSDLTSTTRASETNINAFQIS